MPDESLPLGDRLQETLTAARFERFDVPGTLLAVGDMELLYVIRAHDDRFVLRRSSRGGQEIDVGTADEAGILLDYLRFLVHGGVYGVTSSPDEVAPGYRIDSTAERLTLVAPGDRWRLDVPDGIGARRELQAFSFDHRSTD